MTTYILCGAIVFLLVFIGWREYCLFRQVLRHEAERRDLYNRIMARDLDDYRTEAGGRPLPASRNFVKAGLKRSLNAMGRNYQEGD
ncbi:MAG: hypothetical protein K6U74_01395 [Firmicutes bacterium]|nr:hypothetical protein [Bacillota bacterium]